MSVQIKQEPTEDDPMDEKVFSRLQIQIDRLKEEIKTFRKLQKPVKKRLRERMETEGLETLQCGEFVLTQKQPSSEDEGLSIIFSEKNVTAFFDEDQILAYMNDPENQRKSRKRPRLTCERQIVELDNDSDQSSAESEGEEE